MLNVSLGRIVQSSVSGRTTGHTTKRDRLVESCNAQCPNINLQ